MEHERMRELVGEARVARLATLTSGLRPHVVPVTYALAGDVVYTAVDHKRKQTRDLARIRNVAAHPDVSLLVDHYDDDWSKLWWVRIDGVAHILREGDKWEPALDLLAEKYEQYREQRPDGPVIGIEITRWRGWSAS